MKQTRIYIISLLVSVLSFFSCTYDDDVQEQEVVDCCVQTAWSNGRGGGETRTLASFLADMDDKDLVISAEDYPKEIVLLSQGNEYKLTRSTFLNTCTEHSGFYQGYSSKGFSFNDIDADKGVTASAQLDGIDDLYSKESDIKVEGLHLQITMHHSKALLRFAFKVDARYDMIRYIKVTNIKLNDGPCFMIDKVLNKDNLQLIGYAYLEVDPEVSGSVNTSTNNTIQCTYDIYDKDASPELLNKPLDELTDAEKTELAAHCTREAVTAQNTFKLGSLKDAGDKLVTELKAGYYYDLNITLNPDYLYVLSEHDNKHLKIE